MLIIGKAISAAIVQNEVVELILVFGALKFVNFVRKPETCHSYRKVGEVAFKRLFEHLGYRIIIGERYYTVLRYLVTVHYIPQFIGYSAGVCKRENAVYKRPRTLLAYAVLVIVEAVRHIVVQHERILGRVLFAYAYELVYRPCRRHIPLHCSNGAEEYLRGIARGICHIQHVGHAVLQSRGNFLACGRGEREQSFVHVPVIGTRLPHTRLCVRVSIGVVAVQIERYVAVSRGHHLIYHFAYYGFHIVNRALIGLEELVACTVIIGEVQLTVFRSYGLRCGLIVGFGQRERLILSVPDVCAAVGHLIRRPGKCISAVGIYGKGYLAVGLRGLAALFCGRRCNRGECVAGSGIGNFLVGSFSLILAERESAAAKLYDLRAVALAAVNYIGTVHKVHYLFSAASTRAEVKVGNDARIGNFIIAEVIAERHIEYIHLNLNAGAL